jgi:hypothetical protein
VFAAHQLVEALIWSGPDGLLPEPYWRAAVMVYLAIALPVLPLLLPVAALLLEPPGARWRIAPFVVLGAVVSIYLVAVLVGRPVSVTGLPCGLQYVTGVDNEFVWAVLNVVAAVGPALMSATGPSSRSASSTS